MIQTLMDVIKSKTSNDAFSDVRSKRKTPRRYADKCVVAIKGQLLPIKDWSLGGFLATADARLFSEGQPIEFILKFKIRNMVLDVPHSGTVVRKSNGRIAVKFEPLNSIAKRRFQKIIDDSVANEFATSQA